MVRPIKSDCCGRLRPRTETTTFRRVGDKESKLTTIRTNGKNGNNNQRDAAVECQL
jgi:hypothetical protein